jgi:hypothetical protein
MESTPRALETPASARTRALGFTYDSESDDPYSDAVVVGSAARGPSRFRASASVAPRTPASVASATRARELAKARAFRESSRERASLKQHCEALEEKVRQLESANAHAETARLKLEAEIDAAAENDEWLRRALEARAAATTEAERERAALAMRVAELEREREVAEACLQSAEAARDATKRRLKRASAAEKAGRLAAEATAAALNGEVARLKRQAQGGFRLSPARRAVAETVDFATSPMPACLLEQRSAIKAEFGVDLDADDAERLAEDAREEAEATGRRRRVAARSPATNARESRAAADASPLPPRALAMSPAASRDDSAMGGIGDDADDSRTGGAEGGTGGGSEEVSKPVAGTKGGATRRAALVSHPAAIVFEYTPESKPPKSRSTLAVASDRKGPLAVAPPVAFEPPMAAVSAFAGVDAEVFFESAAESTLALVAAAASASRAALAPEGVVTVAAKRLGARLAVGLAITALVMLALIVFGGDPPGARLAVRAGGWHPGWRRETWWGARVMRAMLGVAA